MAVIEDTRIEDTLVDRVAIILEQCFPGSDVNVGRFYGAERVHGRIIWSGFEDLDDVDRQHAIHKALRKSLGADVRGISIILGYTPREIELMESV
ncbi:MAG: hypothetical protein M3Y56_13755 [Armatimonadota bacterium]|nr:hypothetical protein [Armatimonadota bacterium]